MSLLESSSKSVVSTPTDYATRTYGLEWSLWRVSPNEIEEAGERRDAKRREEEIGEKEG